jgi:hypothetical protein
LAGMALTPPATVDSDVFWALACIVPPKTRESRTSTEIDTFKNFRLNMCSSNVLCIEQ